MKYHLLGRSGLRVSELCLGTMTFGEEWGWGGTADDSRRMAEAFAAAGGNFVDTANLYTNGSSERIVGELIASDRDYWVLATKYSLATAKHMNGSGNHRKSMCAAVDASLRRLGTDYIDLYWLHAWDFTTPVDEVMRAFDDLVRAGKVHYIGVSDTPAWIVAQANTLAELRGWSRFIGLQIEYSLVERTPERELLPMAEALGLGLTPWSPLGQGVLTGKYAAGVPEGPARLTEPLRAARFLTERNRVIAAEVVDVARDLGRSPAQVALRWLLDRPQGCIPIVGARRPEQLADNLAAVEFTLEPAQRQRLDEVSAIELGFPHQFLCSPTVRDFAFAGTLDKLENPRDPQRGHAEPEMT